MMRRFLPGAIRFADWALRPRIFLPVVTIIFVAFSGLEIYRNVHSPAGLKLLFSGDTHHYLDIAQDFARGDFSMSYVQRRPHRQPLYPFFLSPIFRWGGGSPVLLSAASTAIIFATFLLFYGLSLRRFRSRLASAATGSLFLAVPFVREQTTDRLLSEPLHLLLMVGIVFSALDWLENRRFRSLLLAFGLVGLDYLDRANGLFVAVAMLGAFGLNELWRPPSEIFAERGRALLQLGARYAAGILLFVAVSAPSWVPRLTYFGNPIHHGYLSNYMWVDTYAEGHVGQKFAKYSARDYFASHGAADVVKRWVQGTWRCGVVIPIAAENRLPVLYFLAVVGLAITGWCGPRSCRVLAIFGLVQMLPLVWTNLSNPNVRVPLAALLPFQLFFSTYGLAHLIAVASRNEKAGRLFPVAERPRSVDSLSRSRTAD